MQIKIIVIGKLKEKYWQEAAGEYLKRLKSYAAVEILEVPEERLPEKPSPAEIRQALQKEGERVERLLGDDRLTIALAIEGQSFSSPQLAAKLEQFSLEGKSRLAFLIGSSYGLGAGLMARADLAWSFSRLTFPHQMMRVILLEQLYRAFSIHQGGKYHK
ncbi:MAG: 23S rRNA (pseudouridine(1915)-N(3))-methyltransferase RlmH [Clostridia bacterium]|jgi:23S rRNA (pseudouridine1915-N3)-methyltransferase|nr:23S rRNA (pseudouridine(1915)-N(3))-methyltransferase RlmH [Clostridia bacterium]